MPRNEIAAIIGLIVAFWWVFAGPGREETSPRSPRALGRTLASFLVAFVITWIVLRLFDY
jgi:uncharacterized membrane protein